MKIAIIHTQYVFPGGEDVVVQNEHRLLQDMGNQVKVFLRSNKTIEELGVLAKVKNLLAGIWSKRSVASLVGEVSAFQPDLVHIHNLWYQMNPALIVELKKAGIPIVVTLHNFRLLCVNAVFFRHGGVCHKCLKGSRWWGVYHKCYRGSRFLSLLPYAMAGIGHFRGIWKDKVDAYVSLTSFSKGLFIQAGFPPHKLHIKPNFVETNFPIPAFVKKRLEPTAVFVGRFSEEKGVQFLLSAWKNRKEQLVLVGSGEIENHHPNVRILGHLTREKVMECISESWILIVPSLWNETFGLAVVEGFRMRTPVLASSNGTFDTLIEDGVTGILFKLGDPQELNKALDRLFSDAELRERLSENAFLEIEKRFSAKKNYGVLQEIYLEALQQGKKGKSL